MHTLIPTKKYPHCGIYWSALLHVTRAFHTIVFASTLGDPGINPFIVIAIAMLLLILNLAVGREFTKAIFSLY